MKRFLAYASTLVFLSLLPAVASPYAITATVSGSPTPPTGTFPDVIQNGDFTIHPNKREPPVGDGLWESTTWTFDFTEDPHYSCFSTSIPLSSAMLTLWLVPTVAVKNDGIWIGGFYWDAEYENINWGLSKAFIPGTDSMRPYQPQEVSMDLLDFYSSDDILAAFNGGYTGLPLATGWYTEDIGHIPIYHENDAIIYKAELQLAPIPEPATIFLMTAGLICHVVYATIGLII